MLKKKWLVYHIGATQSATALKNFGGKNMRLVFWPLYTSYTQVFEFKFQLCEFHTKKRCLYSRPVKGRWRRRWTPWKRSFPKSRPRWGFATRSSRGLPTLERIEITTLTRRAAFARPLLPRLKCRQLRKGRLFATLKGSTTSRKPRNIGILTLLELLQLKILQFWSKVAVSGYLVRLFIFF